MELTIVGCGYVGQTLARRLQPRRPQLGLTLTTTRQERRVALRQLGDDVMVCDATDPKQLLNEEPREQQHRCVLPWPKRKSTGGSGGLPTHLRR